MDIIQVVIQAEKLKKKQPVKSDKYIKFSKYPNNIV